MNDNAQKIKQAMNILAGLCPRVDQVSTIAQPIAYVVNLLADVRDQLNQPPETADAPKE